MHLPATSRPARLLLSAALLFSSFAAAAESVPLDLAAWRFTNTGKFEAWTDRRGLTVLHHPWDISEKDFAATAAQSITIPAAWSGPLRLHFYMTDDYDGSTAPVTEGWLGQINLPGHRFKQVLINGEVAWQQDVADATDIALPTRFSVDLAASVKPGDSVRVTFRLVDIAGSMERLPGDHRHVGDTDAIQESDPWKFMTHLYVGDVAIAPATEVVEAGVMPAIALTRRASRIALAHCARQRRRLARSPAAASCTVVRSVFSAADRAALSEGRCYGSRAHKTGRCRRRGHSPGRAHDEYLARWQHPHRRGDGPRTSRSEGSS